jgi:tetratricopeptide (TPR) repeat protein
VIERVQQFPWDLDKDGSGQLDLRRFRALAAGVRGDAFAAKDQKAEALAAWREAAALLDGLVLQHPDQPGLLAESATPHLAACRMLERLGSPDEALTRSRELIAKLEQNARGPAGAMLALARLDAHRTIGGILVRAGRFTDAEKEIRAAIALALEAGEESPAAAFIADLYADLGDACQGLGRPAEALAAHDEAERRGRQVLAKNYRSLPLRQVLVRSLVGKAAALIALGTPDPARPLLDEARVVSEQLHSEGAVAILIPGDLALAAGYQDLGNAQIALGQDAAAIPTLECAVQLLDLILPRMNERLDTRMKLCAIQQAIARAHLRLGHSTEAAASFQKALNHAKVLRKHLHDEARWLFTIMDCHIELLALPQIPNTGSHAQRRGVLAQCFEILHAMGNLSDEDRRKIEELRIRLAEAPKQ